MKQTPSKQQIEKTKGCLTTSAKIAVVILGTLIVLKITGAINFGWLWILSPIWIPTLISLVAWITTEIVTILKK